LAQDLMAAGKTVMVSEGWLTLAVTGFVIGLLALTRRPQPPPR
jgi:hypothetical protein